MEAAVVGETEAVEPVFLDETEGVEPESESVEPESEAVEDTELKRIRFAADKQELYDVISNFDDSWYRINDVDYMVEEAAVDTVGATADSSAMKADTSSPAAAAPDYSDVNVRQEGVDEADVIRTDGKYIYTKEGAQFSYRHPDIVSVETPEKKAHEEEIPAAEEPVKEPKKRKSSKKKTAKEE